MSAFKWDEHYVTGQDEVDRQHQRLVSILNGFGELLAMDEVDFDEIGRILAQLTDYTEYHFAEEEALMMERGVSPRHREKHLVQHSDFVESVKATQKELESHDVGTAKRLYDMLVHWIAYHILGADQNMARQLVAIEEGMTPQEAYIRYEQESALATEPLLVALGGLFDAVSMRNRELRELAASLETKVSERTLELAIANELLEELALTDGLTGLPNRRSAMRSLEKCWFEALDGATPLVCMMVDVDHFKEINDTYGHDVGDAYLRAFSKALRDAMRPEDVVCRLGGDEFLVLCPNTELPAAIDLAETACLSIGKMNPMDWGGTSFVTICIGVALMMPGMAHLDELLKAADVHTYMAKEAGRNRVHWSDNPE